MRSHTAADVLAGRESSRECAVGWGTGGLGLSSEQPSSLPDVKREQHPEGSPGDPGVQGLAARLRGAGGGSRACSPFWEAQLVHLSGLENPHPWGGKRRWDFSWGQNRTPPARDNGSKSLNNPTPVDEGTQHPGDRRSACEICAGEESPHLAEKARRYLCVKAFLTLFPALHMANFTQIRRN